MLPETWHLSSNVLQIVLQLLQDMRSQMPNSSLIKASNSIVSCQSLGVQGSPNILIAWFGIINTAGPPPVDPDTQETQIVDINVISTPTPTPPKAHSFDEDPETRRQKFQVSNKASSSKDEPEHVEQLLALADEELGDSKVLHLSWKNEWYFNSVMNVSYILGKLEQKNENWRSTNLDSV